MMDWRQRRGCGNLKPSDEVVTVMGWVDTIRDHGHLLFIHLRDRSGVVQVVFDPERNAHAHALAQTLRMETVVSVVGTVQARSKETRNPKLPTGDIEIDISDLHIFSKADPLPFMVSEKETDEPAAAVDEDIRLRYRYLDLRRPSMQKNLLLRYQLTKLIRAHLDIHGFVEVETPILTKSTPEGARDYLVPSRVHDGQFYALPQSPQLFKQLLMVSGLERYFQIAKCFRDEDLRPNRQPEFTQVDIEASFIDQDFIVALIEPLIQKLFETVGVTLNAPFPVIPYDEAMRRFGSDRPDLRFGLEMLEVSDLFADTNYQIFKSIVANGGLITGLNIKGASDRLSKNALQNDYAKTLIPKLGGKGMTWMRVENGQLESNIVQFFSESEIAAIRDRLGAEDGDVLVFVADRDPHLARTVLGKFRLFIAQELGLIDPAVVKPCWVVDFPLLERVDGRLSSMHHPFTRPKGAIARDMTPEQLLATKACAYDIVLNGEEVGGGSLRIYDPDMQALMFGLLGLSQAEIDEKFGFLVRAFRYGTPPHGGIALGLDRLVSMIAGTESIRDVIAFPKNRNAYCPLTDAPNSVTAEQLREVHIQVSESKP
jgi:aspartyl-tRNA synthetase